jgi:serine/threonine protein kinase
MPLRGENATYPAYTALQQIQGGANGLIHLARHTGWGLHCVQKTYDRPGRSDAVAFAEPRLLRSVDHDHIVKIIDAQPDGHREHAVTMVMPYYPDGDVFAALARGDQFSVGQVVEFSLQIATALDHLHTVHHLCIET